MFLYDSLSKSLKELIPVNSDGILRIYVCGPTVYDKTHIGHARVYTFFDSLVNYLKLVGHKVKYIINFTDIDDKIIKKSKEEKVPWQEISDRYERYFMKYMEWLKVDPPTSYVRATRHITEIIEFVSKLIDEGYAYTIDDGIYFNVRKFKRYGELSNQSLEKIEKYYRIEPNPKKKSKADFALWKFKKPTEPYWYAPIGVGRPGWHIECSTMILTHLGSKIDIHGGGEDLIFPHHENEIAQTESITKIHPWVNIWMHVGLVKIEGEKMSKSLGNIITLDEIEKKTTPEVLRFIFLRTHWRSPLNFSYELIEECKSSVERINSIFFELKKKEILNDFRDKNIISSYMDNKKIEFVESLSKNFDTPKAISIIFEVCRKINSNIDKLGEEDVRKSLEFFEMINSVMKIIKESIVDRKFIEFIEKLINIRNKIRKMKMYEISDEIRNILNDLGIIVKDYKDKSEWSVKLE